MRKSMRILTAFLLLAGAVSTVTAQTITPSRPLVAAPAAPKTFAEMMMITPTGIKGGDIVVVPMPWLADWMGCTFTTSTPADTVGPNGEKITAVPDSVFTLAGAGHTLVVTKGTDEALLDTYHIRVLSNVNVVETVPFVSAKSVMDAFVMQYAFNETPPANLTLTNPKTKKEVNIPVYDLDLRSKTIDMTTRLGVIRAAIKAYRNAMGFNPALLVDMVWYLPDRPAAGPHGEPIPAGAYKGPYLPGNQGIDGSGIPKNPFVNSNDTRNEVHWLYDPETGTIKSTPNFPTPDGVDLNSL